MFTSKLRQTIEIANEFLLALASIRIQVCCGYIITTTEERDMTGDSTLAIIGVLFAVNAGFLVSQIVLGIREWLRSRWINKTKVVHDRERKKQIRAII